MLMNFTREKFFYILEVAAVDRKIFPESWVRRVLLENPDLPEAYVVLALLSEGTEPLEHIHCFSGDVTARIPLILMSDLLGRLRRRDVLQTVLKRLSGRSGKLATGFALEAITQAQQSNLAFRVAGDVDESEVLRSVASGTPEADDVTLIVAVRDMDHARKAAEVHHPFHHSVILAAPHSAKPDGDADLGALCLFGPEEFFMRNLAAVDACQTKYVMLVGYDDFVFPEFLEAAADLLDRNPSVSHVMGHGFDLILRGTQEAIIAKANFENPFHDPNARLQEAALAPMSLWNMVHRRDDLLSAFQHIAASKFDGFHRNLFEAAYDGIGLLQGAVVGVRRLSIVRARLEKSASYHETMFLSRVIGNEENVFLELFLTMKEFCQEKGVVVSENILQDYCMAYLCSGAALLPTLRRRSFSSERIWRSTGPWSALPTLSEADHQKLSAGCRHLRNRVI